VAVQLPPKRLHDRMHLETKSSRHFPSSPLSLHPLSSGPSPPIRARRATLDPPLRSVTVHAHYRPRAGPKDNDISRNSSSSCCPTNTHCATRSILELLIGTATSINGPEDLGRYLITHIFYSHHLNALLIRLSERQGSLKSPVDLQDVPCVSRHGKYYTSRRSLP
jgi:hypothetical protein